MEKSAFRTTLAHGPGQPAGGVKENAWSEKSANTKPVNNGTTQGVVPGRVTGGSAVAVFADPITSPGGGIVCARLAHALVMITMARSALLIGKINFDGFGFDEREGRTQLSLTPPKLVQSLRGVVRWVKWTRGRSELKF